MATAFEKLLGQFGATVGATTVSALEAENKRLRVALKTIREGTVSGHINYEPVREFIDRTLKD